MIKRLAVMVLLTLLAISAVSAYFYIDTTDVPVPIPANHSNISRNQRFDIKWTTDGDISSCVWCVPLINGTLGIGRDFCFNNTWEIMGFLPDEIPYGEIQYQIHCYTAADFGASGQNYTPLYTYNVPRYAPTYSPNDLAPAAMSGIAKFFIVLGQLIGALVIFLLVTWIITKVRQK